MYIFSLEDCGRLKECLTIRIDRDGEGGVCPCRELPNPTHFFVSLTDSELTREVLFPAKLDLETPKSLPFIFVHEC